jgi:nitrogen regulatory protein P-II 1
MYRSFKHEPAEAARNLQPSMLGQRVRISQIRLMSTISSPTRGDHAGARQAEQKGYEMLANLELGALRGWASCHSDWFVKLEFIQRGQTSMTKIEAIIQPARFEAVKDALIEKGVQGMTISDVRGHGRQKGHTEVYRGREYSVDLLPKIKIEAVVADELVDGAVQAILTAAATGKIGDGKIFLSKVDEVIRIRNQERGAAAI